MVLPTLTKADLAHQAVIIRFDGDVPTSPNGQTIADDWRLQAVVPTIETCLAADARVVLLAHRGRPDGRADPAYSNHILADYFTQVLHQPVAFQPNLLEDDWRPTAAITLGENLRFYPGEEANDPRFAHKLARLGTCYVNDAFGVSHRSHASIVGVPRLLPHMAGFRLAREVSVLDRLRHDPDLPYAVILGGAKASDKAGYLQAMFHQANAILLGGLLAIIYLAAQGHSVGQHEVSGDEMKEAQRNIRFSQEAGVELVLPVDFVNQDRSVKPVTDFAAADFMLDIGPATVDLFASVVRQANTVFWNGALGKYEEPAFAAGTHRLAQILATEHGETVRIASGGDTVGAIRSFGLERGFTFLSTGGGATLAFLGGESLPGLDALTSPYRNS